MHSFSIKTAHEIAIMTDGGKKLGEIRDQLAEMTKPGITTLDIDKMADKLIKKSGGEASFKLVEGYKHATCTNVNEEVVHSIPSNYVIKEGDRVGIDVGLFYKGYHTDTSVSVIATSGKKKHPALENFLAVGEKGLDLAIAAAVPGNRVADVSKQMQVTCEKAGYSMVQALTGHGIGRNLHEEPAIPCFVLGEYRHSPKLVPGMVIAIEIMYNLGTSEVVYKNADGWTIITADGKISGLFEQTVAITKNGPVVLTNQ